MSGGYHYHEAVKRLLAEIDKFLQKTLNTETLSKNAEKERKSILKNLKKLFSDHDSLVTCSGDEGSVSSSKDGISFSTEDSRIGTETSHVGDEDGYSEHIPDQTVQALSTQATRYGFMDRKLETFLVTSWKKQYCVLHRNILFIFKGPKDKKQHAAFCVTGYEFREAPHLTKDEKKKDCMFELVCPGKKTYQFSCDSKEDLVGWKRDLTAASETSAIPGDNEDIYEPFPENGEGGIEIEDADAFYDDTEVETKKTSPASAKLPPPPPKVIVPGTVSNHNQEPEEDDELVYEPIESVEELPAPKSPSLSAKEALGKHTRGALPPVPVSASLPPPPPRTALKDHENLPLPPPPLDLPPLPPHERDVSIPPPLPSSRRPDAPPLPPTSGRALPPPPKDPLPQPPVKGISPQLGKILHPSEDFENLFYGKWDCTGLTSNELNFKRGQIIHVISRDLDKDDWWVGALEDKVGLVPKVFLTPAYELVR